MNKGKLTSVDLILFQGIIGTIGVAHSLLLTSGTVWESTTWFYVVTWASSLVILLWCWVRYKEEGQFKYDEPLTQDKLYFVFGGIIVTVLLSAILVRAYTKSSIWVPQPQMTLTVGSLSLSAVVNDLFYQLALVSNSEEILNLSMSQIVRRKLVESIPLKFGTLVPILSILIPRCGWGVLHAYRAYVGPLQPILVLSAIISGCVISYCAYNKKVNCFLVALLIHFGFNASVVLANAASF